jgi:hypothetical protein
MFEYVESDTIWDVILADLVMMIVSYIVVVSFIGGGNSVWVCFKYQYVFTVTYQN